MYAVLNTGGKQYKVENGDIVLFEKLDGKEGESVVFDNILMTSDKDGNIMVGRPHIESASVNGHIVEQGKSKKVIVFKYKKRKRYRRKAGHRQLFTAVEIDSINLDSN